MPYQAKIEPPVEPLHLATMTVMFDAHKMLYDFGYRGSFSTTTSSVENNVIESGRFDMGIEAGVPVVASLGDVILYRASPPEVVACITHDEFVADYEEVI